MIHEQFENLEQQQEASHLGLWLFLATEVLFFGGLFLAYTVYRWSYPEAFAVISRETDALLGSINTAVLLTSSLFMALAVHSAKEGKSRAVVRFLALTLTLGIVFMGVKAFEYHEDFAKHLIPGSPEFPFKGIAAPAQLIFFWLYYVMTGLHAFHVMVGLGIIVWMLIRALRGEFASTDRQHVIHNAGLYWHFVDGIWVFLYPLLYLVERQSS